MVKHFLERRKVILAVPQAGYTGLSEHSATAETLLVDDNRKY